MTLQGIYGAIKGTAKGYYNPLDLPRSMTRTIAMEGETKKGTTGWKDEGTYEKFWARGGFSRERVRGALVIAVQIPDHQRQREDFFAVFFHPPLELKGNECPP